MAVRQPGDMVDSYLFGGAIRLHLDSARRANDEKQNHSGFPREWYIDADFACDTCGQEFRWTAAEQKVWFEEYGFWIDSVPRHCRACIRLKNLRKEYDSIVAAAKSHGDWDKKRRVVEIVTELTSASYAIPLKMAETKLWFERQLAKKADTGKILQPSNTGGGDQPLSDAEFGALLSDLCSRLGFCLPKTECERLCRVVPSSIDAFTDAVFTAGELPPDTADRHLYRQVRALVSNAFRRHYDREQSSQIDGNA